MRKPPDRPSYHHPVSQAVSAEPVRVGLVGYGFGGRVFHAPLIASAPGCVLAGVVARSPERRAEVARDHPGVAVYDSLKALAGAGVDAVSISTPAATHMPLARQAIGLGLPAVVDKPFSLESAVARETVLTAERAGVLLTVYQNRRWDSDLLTVRRLIDEGALGAVRRFESRFERFAPDPGPPASGGGTLLDFGSHLVDQALLLFGPVERVYAEMTDRDDDFFVALRHTGGVVSHLSGSWVQGAPGPRLRVTGTAGSYVVAEPDGQEAALVAGHTPGRDGDRWGAEPSSHWGQLRRGAGSEPVESERGRWDTFYPEFAAAVRGTGPVPVDPWDSVAGLRVLDLARASAAEGRSLTVDTT
jgi:predicted dehydrogenase